MVGIPNYCQTKADWSNAVAYAIKHGKQKDVLINRLKRLRDDVYTRKLTSEAEARIAEEAAAAREAGEEYEATYSASDYEKIENPKAAKFVLGFTDAEINALIKKLEA